MWSSVALYFFTLFALFYPHFLGKSRKEEIKRLNYRLKKLDRFYRNIVLALGIMSPVFLVLYLAAEHCFWFCWFVGFILGLLDAVSIRYADEIFRWDMSWLFRRARNE